MSPCQRCGATNDPSSRFCVACGAPVAAARPNPAPSPPEPVAPPQPSYAAPSHQPVPARAPGSAQFGGNMAPFGLPPSLPSSELPFAETAAPLTREEFEARGQGDAAAYQAQRPSPVAPAPRSSVPPPIPWSNAAQPAPPVPHHLGTPAPLPGAGANPSYPGSVANPSYPGSAATPSYPSHPGSGSIQPYLSHPGSGAANPPHAGGVASHPSQSSAGHQGASTAGAYPQSHTSAPPPPVYGTTAAMPGIEQDPEAVPERAPRVLAGFLVSYEVEPLGRFWPIYQGRNRLGRKGSGTDLDIEIDHPTTSSRHAMILASACPGRLKLEDIGSTNGTLLNGVRITPGTRLELKDGDRVRFGLLSTIVKVV